MSADTFIGVWKFKDWYRVTWIEQAPDNLVYNPRVETKEEFEDTVRLYFKNSKLYSNIEDAIKKANIIRDKFEQDDEYWMDIEYWIQFYNFNFKI